MASPIAMFPVGRVGHIEPPRAGDRFAGIQHTLSRGLHAQDVNVHVTADGHVVPGHYDELRSNGINAPGTIGHHTLAELREHGVQPVTDWFEWAATHNFALMLEWKPDVHTTDTVAELAWKRVKDEADRTGAKVAVMSIQSWAPRRLSRTTRRARLARWEQLSKARLRTVMHAGLPTVLLWRSPIPATSDWWPLVSAVKSMPAARRLPKGVMRIGRGKQVKPPKRRRRHRRHHPRLHRVHRRRRHHPRRTHR